MRAASAPRGGSSGGRGGEARPAPLCGGGSGSVSGARRWQVRLLVASLRAGVMAPWGSAEGSPAWRSAQLLLLVVSCCGRYRGSDASLGPGGGRPPRGRGEQSGLSPGRPPAARRPRPAAGSLGPPRALAPPGTTAAAFPAAALRVSPYSLPPPCSAAPGLAPGFFFFLSMGVGGNLLREVLKTATGIRPSCPRLSLSQMCVAGNSGVGAGPRKQTSPKSSESRVNRCL